MAPRFWLKGAKWLQDFKSYVHVWVTPAENVDLQPLPDRINSDDDVTLPADIIAVPRNTDNDETLPYGLDNVIHPDEWLTEDATAQPETASQSGMVRNPVEQLNLST